MICLRVASSERDRAHQNSDHLSDSLTCRCWVDIGTAADRQLQRFRFGNFESIHPSTTSWNSVAFSKTSLASVSVATWERV